LQLVLPLLLFGGCLRAANVLVGDPVEVSDDHRRDSRTIDLASLALLAGGSDTLGNEVLAPLLNGRAGNLALCCFVARNQVVTNDPSS